LPYTINTLSKRVLYTDDTSISCFNSNSNELVIALKDILEVINEWFSINSLSLNLKQIVFSFIKTKYIKNINMNYGDTQINNTYNLKFLGLIIDSIIIIIIIIIIYFMF
jgi:hypothetical protein